MKQVKRYKVFPGYIKSKNDETLHYISFLELCTLYKVNPKECVNMKDVYKVANYSLKFLETLQSLHPKCSGDYKL